MHGQITSTKRELQEKGFTTKMSPFWELRWFAPDFFLRFGTCYLHTSLLGNWTRHTLYLCAKYGVKMCSELNQRVMHHPRYPTLKPLIRGIVKQHGSRLLGRPILHLLTFTAEEVSSWIQISPIVLHGLVNDEDYECWMDHLEADTEVFLYPHSKTNLEQLRIKIWLWKESFKQLLCTDGSEEDDCLLQNEDICEQAGDEDVEDTDLDVSDAEGEVTSGRESASAQDYLEQSDNTLNENEHCVDLSDADTDDTLHVTSTSWRPDIKQISLLSSGFTCRYPKFENENHWPDLINFLGPTQMMDTKPYENQHLEKKMLAHVTNQKNIDKAILRLTDLLRAHNDVALLKNVPFKGFHDSFPTTKGQPHQWRGSLKQEFAAALQRFHAELSLDDGYRVVKGIHFGGFCGSEIMCEWNMKAQSSLCR
jgi:hypothetical protein